MIFTSLALRLMGAAWISVNSVFFVISGSNLQVIGAGATVFSAADLILGSMIVGSYLVHDRRLSRIEENQIKMQTNQTLIMEHLKIKVRA